MMKTLGFIQENGNNISALSDILGIIVKEYPEEGLYVLNYDQINSPKTHPVVMECRGLILDNSFNIISRSFDRFFNLGEAPDTQAHLDWNKASIFDKVDGSLIKLYYWKDKWHFATRGTAFAESDCMGFGVTFNDLCLQATGVSDNDDLQARIERADLDPGVTYILELTCRENRVVTVYEGTKLHFLAARRNMDGEFVSVPQTSKDEMYWEEIKSFSFGNPEEIIKAAGALPNLQEGYVVYQDGKPVCKVKSPAYVAVHHLRGNGTPNTNRVMELVLLGEEEEYLTYFPEDRCYFDPVVAAKESLEEKIETYYETVKDITEQKEFALAVKDTPFSGVLFQARQRDKSAIEVFNALELNRKRKLLQSFVEGG